MYSNNFSILSFTETWLSDYIYNKEIIPSGYSILRKDRNGRSGGVMVAVKDSIPCKQLLSPSNLEVITIKLNLTKPVILCSVYCTPSSTSDYQHSLIDYLCTLTQSSDSLNYGRFQCP